MTQARDSESNALVPGHEGPDAATWRDCLSPASFWPPEQLGPQVAWLEHAPFAFWLIETLRPRTLVELGTHGGFSYFVCCQAVQRLQLETRCYAVDTWRGDEHAGFYGEDVFEEVSRYHRSRYSAFSTLVRATFDDAVRSFQNGTIDLLHIDGRHFYADVKHDFETWRPKLSDRGVVLLHDTNIRDGSFGVFRLWEELRLEYRHFEFLHGHGLGVLGIGHRLPDRLGALFRAAADGAAVSQLRGTYSRLGSAVSLSLSVQRQGVELRQWKIETDALRKDIALRAEEAERLRTDLARRADEAEALRQQIASRAEDSESLRQQLARRTGEAEALRRDLAQRTDEAKALRKEVVLRTDDALERRRETAALVRETKGLEAEIAARVAEIEGVRDELTSRIRETEALRAEIATRTSEAETLRRQHSALTTEIRWLETELLATRRGLTEGQSAREAPSGETVRLHAALGQAQQRLAELGTLVEVQRRELEPMRNRNRRRIAESTSRVRSRYLRLAEYPRRLLTFLLAGKIGPAPDHGATSDRGPASDQGPASDHGSAPDHGPVFEADFLDLYFRSAGFSDPPATTCIRLREAGWPVYGTRAEAESVAAVIRASDLFDAAEYADRLGRVQGIDPALHYVLVGEQMGFMPSRRFDPTYYRERYPDVAAARTNLLGHYLSWGWAEGRRPLSVAAGLRFDRSRIDLTRDTVLLIVHQASRTGAPIVAYNIARRLRRKYNVVAVLLAGGELVPHFDASCAAVIGPLTYADWNPVEAEYLVRHLTASYRVFMAIANSIESRFLLPALAYHLVPVVTLVHEFASYTRPAGAMGQALDWSTQIVFSADLVARAAQREHPTLTGRSIHVLRQGRCDVPPRWNEDGSPARSAEGLDHLFRPKGAENALVVLGCGTVHLRKGVDLFLSCAAAVAALGPRRPVRFVWIGHGYEPETDVTYSCYLAEQIAHSGLEDSVTILDEVPDLEPAYRLADVFFLSSRLDPLPNVTIEAALRGLPVVCFDGATGMAEVLGADARAHRSVVPHLDVAAAARVIADFAADDDARREAGAVTRRLAESVFEMDRYVNRVDELGIEAARLVRQRAQDFDTIRDDALFDERVYVSPEYPFVTRDQAIIGFLARWTAVGLSRQPASNGLFRRPCAGFHPQIYAHENASRYDAATVNPFADFIRGGKRNGPWCAELITPPATREASTMSGLRVALHGHFFYPELAADFMRKMAVNRWPCDLLLSTDSEAKATALRESTADYARGEVLIRVVPNRGRDLGPLLTAFAEEVTSRYDVVGHLHGKRSLMTAEARLGETWREFLWQNLLGDRHPMMDVIVDRFAVDQHLGLVFAADPHLSDWDANLARATELAARMGIAGPLPPFFDFPIGTMFWARPEALRPLVALKLDWDDYPGEPVPIDGTILHALERLLPFAAHRAGYRCATSHVAGLTW
jgi:glycosyltransferase involved in cell wall biosynthesis